MWTRKLERWAESIVSSDKMWEVVEVQRPYSYSCFISYAILAGNSVQEPPDSFRILTALDTNCS